MSPGKAPPSELPARSSVTTTAEKVVVTSRFPRDLADFLSVEAKRRGWSMNEFLVTITHDLYTWYALPEMDTEQLEEDRAALELILPTRQKGRPEPPRFRWELRPLVWRGVGDSNPWPPA